MPWKFVCDLRFHRVLQTTIIWQITKGNEEIEKYSLVYVCVKIYTRCQCIFTHTYTKHHLHVHTQ